MMDADSMSIVIPNTRGRMIQGKGPGLGIMPEAVITVMRVLSCMDNCAGIDMANCSACGADGAACDLCGQTKEECCIPLDEWADWQASADMSVFFRNASQRTPSIFFRQTRRGPSVVSATSGLPRQ